MTTPNTVVQSEKDSADSMALFLKMYDESIRTHKIVQQLVTAGMYGLARDLCKELHEQAHGPNTQPVNPKNPRIDWLSLGQKYDPHLAALAALNVSKTSKAHDRALHSVAMAGKSEEKQDRDFTRSLVTDGYTRKDVESAMALARQTANAHAKANSAAEKASPLITDDVLAAIVAAEKICADYAAETARLEHAKMSALKALVPAVRLLSGAVQADPMALLETARTNNGAVIPQSIADINNWRNVRAAMATQLSKGGMFYSKNVANLLDAMIRDSGVTFPVGVHDFAGLSIVVSKTGIEWPAKFRQDGYAFLSHDEHGNPKGGFRLVSGLYKGGDIDQAALKGNGTVHLEICADTNKVIADLINPVLAAHSVAFYARSGKTETTAGDSQYVKAIESLVK